jgi:hypothetical protein
LHILSGSFKVVDTLGSRVVGPEKVYAYSISKLYVKISETLPDCIEPVGFELLEDVQPHFRDWHALIVELASATSLLDHYAPRMPPNLQNEDSGIIDEDTVWIPCHYILQSIRRCSRGPQKHGNRSKEAEKAHFGWRELSLAAS